jgi:hypothetical protein
MRGALLKVGVVLALGLFGPSAASAQDPDLAGEWHLDAIAGGRTPDTAGHGDTGHVVGAPTVVADGRFGGGLHFPTKGSAINAGDIATLQPRSLSLLAWVRSSSVPSTVKNIVAQGGQSSCSFASYALYTGGSTQVSGVHQPARDRGRADGDVLLQHRHLDEPADASGLRLPLGRPRERHAGSGRPGPNVHAHERRRRLSDHV